jgi:glycosyltransferase involved in cell wall biosynthesis
MQKKILFISTKSVWGGAQRYIIDLVDYLPRDEFIMEVAAGGRGPLATKIVEKNIRYHEMKNIVRDIGLFREIAAFFETMALLRRVKPDILHLNSSKSSFLGAVAGKILGVPKIISSTHGWPFLEDRPRWQKKALLLLVKFEAFFLDSIICVSHFDYAIAVQEHIGTRKKLIQIHNGLDPARHVFLERKDAKEKLLKKINIADKNHFIIGSIAEYTKNKGLFYLIEAAGHIVKIEPRAIFLLIGWGEEKQFLQQYIYRLNLENNVFLVEYLPEAFSYLKAFDIFVLPSLKEGFAYTLLEASLAELPIITTRVGGNPEIIENLKTGLLVRPASPEELINAVSHLMRNPESRAFGKEARKKAIRDFSIQAMVDLTANVYRSV